MSKIDVEQEAKRRRLTVHVEKKAEREARLKKDEADDELRRELLRHNHEQEMAEAKCRRLKELALFCAAIFSASAIGVACIYIIINESYNHATPSPTYQWQYATSILTAIVSAFLGYLTGKTTSAPPQGARARS
jgi:hypothetical protein